MKAIKTRYLGPTNYRGSRIVATAEGGHRVVISYNHQASQADAHHAAAMALCSKAGWSGHYVGGALEDCWVWVSESAYSPRFHAVGG